MNKPHSRIALLLSNMDGGGAQRSMLRLAEGIAGRGYGVDLVLARAEGVLMPSIPDSVRVINLNASRVSKSIPSLAKYLKQELPTAVLSALDYVNIIAIWTKRLVGGNSRLVVSERSTLSYSSRMSSRYKGRLIRIMAARSYPLADGIVAVSAGVADDLARTLGIQRERIDVIYNPVVTPDLMARASDQLDHEWFKPGQPPVILAVGRLSDEKDFPSLLHAFALVRRSREARLVILGEGDDRALLETLAKDQGIHTDVSLPGFVQNPYPFMTNAAVFVLPSKWEGLPGVLIEALYCGVPLVATDCMSGPREILAEGKYGQLVPVGDVSALAKAIDVALDSNRSSPPPISWQQFDLNNVVDQYIHILLGVN